VWAGKGSKSDEIEKILEKNQLISPLVILGKFSVNCFLMVVEPQQDFL
jgi:hypothetical protein